jgi:hypothetical protein
MPSDFPVRGFPTYLALGDGTDPEPVNISVYFDNVDYAAESDELNGDTFTRRYRLAGDPARTLTLTGKWSPAADEFIRAIEGETDIPYEWGPEGLVTDGKLFSGACNVGYLQGPNGGVDDFEAFTLELKIVTFTVSAIAAATGATAGSPGSFTPAGSGAPANLAGATGVTASPATAWTAGQYVVLGDASEAHWNATTWVAGRA